MKQLISSLVTAAVAGAATSPVWAHEGAHLHPHGTEMTPVLLVLAVLASAYFLLRSR